MASKPKQLLEETSSSETCSRWKLSERLELAPSKRSSQVSVPRQRSSAGRRSSRCNRRLLKKSAARA
jgi:hypothetical protein